MGAYASGMPQHPFGHQGRLGNGANGPTGQRANGPMVWLLQARKSPAKAGLLQGAVCRVQILARRLRKNWRPFLYQPSGMSSVAE
jgi:hypothetical protein